MFYRLCSTESQQRLYLILLPCTHFLVLIRPPSSPLSFRLLFLLPHTTLLLLKPNSQCRSFATCSQHPVSPHQPDFFPLTSPPSTPPPPPQSPSPPPTSCRLSCRHLNAFPSSGDTPRQKCCSSRPQAFIRVGARRTSEAWWGRGMGVGGKGGEGKTHSERRAEATATACPMTAVFYL